MTSLFHYLSVETTEELCLSADDDRQRRLETRAPNTAQGQVGANPIVLDVEEPSANGPTSPSGRAHDEGDPSDMLGDEAMSTTADVLVDSAGAGAETAGPMAGNAT